MTGHPVPTDILTDADGHPNVVAWRLGQVEQGQKELSSKLDIILQNYPTAQTLSILLDPIKADILDLKKKDEQAENAKTQASAQLRLAIIVAILSPLFSIIITMILVKGGN